MFSKLKSLVVGVCAAFALGGAAVAQEASSVELSFNLGVASDYVFRGVSQTDGDVQVSGGFDAELGGGFYAGVWASNVDFGNGTDLEYDIYAGVRPEVGPVALDLAVLHYGYTDAPAGSDQDFWEVKAAAAAPAGPLTLGAAVFYSPEFFGATGPATYAELNFAAPVSGDRVTVSGALGRQWVDEGVDYATWNLGVGIAITDHVSADIRYWGANEGTALGKLADDRVAVGLKASF